MTSPRRVRDSSSVYSAPTIVVNRQRTTAVSEQDAQTMAPETPRRKQRRQNVLATKKEDSLVGQKPQQQVLKLDIAELSKQGYLEVQDGKLRLVIDVENNVL